MKNVGLYFIINESCSQEGIITDVNSAIRAGVKMIQYSEKKLRKREVLENAYVLSALCKKSNVLFIIEDYPDIAALVDADGVHLTQQDFSIDHARKIVGENKFIGTQFFSLRDAVLAEEKGVDYISIGSWTDAAKGATKATVETLKKMRELLTVPIIALGSFSVEQMEELFAAGLDGVAMLPCFFKEEQSEKNMKRILAGVRLQ